MVQPVLKDLDTIHSMNQNLRKTSQHVGTDLPKLRYRSLYAGSDSDTGPFVNVAAVLGTVFSAICHMASRTEA